MKSKQKIKANSKIKGAKEKYIVPRKPTPAKDTADLNSSVNEKLNSSKKKTTSIQGSKLSDEQLKQLAIMALSKKCKDNFYFFVQNFWNEIIAELPVWNWHIKYLCDELQLLSKSIVARDAKPYDLLINIPPGTTKSTIVTQMYPAWLWTQDPTIRIISNSFSATLATDHAMRSRDIILSDKFKKLFPDVKLRDDKSAKTFYANTLGGSRYSTSTSGGVTGEHAHCLVGETEIITTKGVKELRNISVGDFVLSLHNNKLVYDKVVATKKMQSNEIFTIEIGATKINATSEHRFYIKGKGWMFARELKIGDECIEVSDLQEANLHGEQNVFKLLSIKSLKKNNNYLQKLWEAIRKTSLRNKKVRKEWLQGQFLFSKMCSRFLANKKELRDMWETIAIKASKVLQRMPFKNKKAEKIKGKSLSSLWYKFSAENIKSTLLQSKLRKLTSFKKNDFTRKSKIYKRSILCYFVSKREGSNTRARQSNMCSLWEKIGSLSSCKQRQVGQSLRKFSDVMQQMPPKPAYNKGTSTITNIKRDSRTSHEVFDIQTEKTHNFFANKILVHNCILNDDPQNPRQAFSEAFRKAAVEHLKTLATRKVDKANTPTITVMQRLHELDVTGFLLENSTEKIKHICLPAELSPLIKPMELRSNYVDGLLDPIRLNREVLAEMRSDLGAQNYSGQFEQNPVAEGGNIVKRDWFKIVDSTTFAAIYKMQPIHFFVDTAYTSKQDNDPTGILAACKIRNDIYITGAKKVRKEFPELISFLKKYTSINGYDARSTLRIEPKANGLSVIQQLKAQTNLNVVSTPTPKDSKEVRLHTSSPTIEAGHVCLVAGAWNDEFLTEVCGFPAMAHDEYVDLLNYAIDYFILKELKTIDSKIVQGFFW